MEVPATVTSKGQVTIPIAIRGALGIHPGSRVLFRVEKGVVEIEHSGRRAVVERPPDFFALAGSVPVPAELRGAGWPTIRRRAIREHAARQARKSATG